MGAVGPAVPAPAGYRLAELIRLAAGGSFPPDDGLVELVGPYLPRIEAVVGFTGHAVVATALGPGALAAAGADGHGGATRPAVLAALAGPRGEVGTLDVLLAGRGTGWTALPERTDAEAAQHPRVRHACDWRAAVNVHGDERGLVVLARGLGGLPELSFEVVASLRGRGHGRALLREGLGLVPHGETVLACVAAGNASSLRSALAAGLVPIGSVQLVRPGDRR